jgi:hypothetical protein
MQQQQVQQWWCGCWWLAAGAASAVADAGKKQSGESVQDRVQSDLWGMIVCSFVAGEKRC